jgi:thioredoxin 1
MQPHFSKACLGLFVVSLLSLLPAKSHALEVKPYTSKLLAQLQSSGKPVAIQFSSPMCPTCTMQDKTIAKLAADKSLNITVMIADYDAEAVLRAALKIDRKATLVVFKGNKEVNRTQGVSGLQELRESFLTALK